MSETSLPLPLENNCIYSSIDAVNSPKNKTYIKKSLNLEKLVNRIDKRMASTENSKAWAIFLTRAFIFTKWISIENEFKMFVKSLAGMLLRLLETSAGKTELANIMPTQQIDKPIKNLSEYFFVINIPAHKSF